ncbi:ABC transporter [Streptomyces sp. SP18CS02]|uniref:ABC transporter n=1 Tax=Streptomyces sp. SP18CS02 TaxID=3002531 RepID=UPI002E79C41D|nr:ABC transporter [Streptomyces sp. SP18CS02]MEE1756538.1 ABC transporter [Streptomyces sp. SP18CS02]
MTALLRYQTALLLRSQRWLPPVLLYAAYLGIGLRPGEPVLGALGYAAAALLPLAAWLVRICLVQEPPAARSVTAAAAGRERAHLAAILAGTGCAALLGTVTTLVVTSLCAPVGADRSAAVPVPAAALAGLLAAAVCVLSGAAVGALCTRPLLPGRGWSVAATTTAVLLALVAPGSPARAAMTALVTGNITGTVHLPWLSAAAAAPIAAAAIALACRLTAWRA